MTRIRGRALLFLFSAVLSFAAAGEDSLSVSDALSKLSAILSWDPLTQSGTLVKDAHRLVFLASPGDFSVLDGADLVKAPAPLVVDGTLRFPASFVAAASAAFSEAAAAEKTRFRVAAVIVDPGHGGRDSGATATHSIGGKDRTLVEKDLVLDVSKDLRDRLARAYPDKRIIMTRNGDVYPTLEQRVSAANAVKLSEHEAIVYVSVHANASFNKKARGYEVWYLSPEYRRNVIDEKKFAESTDVLPILNAMMEEEFTTESIIIARDIMDGFSRLVGNMSPARGIKAEEWFVVRNARMPSVLVEIGFITNPEDALLLSDGSYLRKLSEAIYSGVREFIAKFERTGGFTAVR